MRLALGFWLADRPLRIADELDYQTLALSIVENGEYSLDGRTPTSLRPPLYPAAVAGVYAVFGSENRYAVWGLQALLSLGTVVLVYRLGSELFSPRAGLWAAGLTCFYPSWLGYTYLLLSETLFTFLLCGACLAFVLGLRRGLLGAAACCGLLFAVAALTRSVVWLFPPVLGAFMLLAWPGNFGRRLAAAALMGAAFAVTLAPWTIRNTRLQQTLTTVDVMGGRNFMMGNYEHTPLFRAWDAISIGNNAKDEEKRWINVLHSESPWPAGTTQGQLDKLALRAGLRFVADHPGLTAERDAIKLLNFWQLERELIAGAAAGFFGVLSKPAILAIAAAICMSYAAAMFTGIFGALLVPPANWRANWFLLLLIAYVCGMHALTFGHSRYHLPLMPLVLLYSGAAVVRAADIWRQRRSPRFIIASLLCAGLAASWVFEIAVVDSQRVKDAVTVGRTESNLRFGVARELSAL